MSTTTTPVCPGAPLRGRVRPPIEDDKEGVPAPKRRRRLKVVTAILEQEKAEKAKAMRVRSLACAVLARAQREVPDFGHILGPESPPATPEPHSPVYWPKDEKAFGVDPRVLDGFQQCRCDADASGCQCVKAEEAFTQTYYWNHGGRAETAGHCRMMTPEQADLIGDANNLFVLAELDAAINVSGMLTMESDPKMLALPSNRYVAAKLLQLFHKDVYVTTGSWQVQFVAKERE